MSWLEKAENSTYAELIAEFVRQIEFAESRNPRGEYPSFDFINRNGSKHHVFVNPSYTLSDSPKSPELTGINIGSRIQNNGKVENYLFCFSKDEPHKLIYFSKHIILEDDTCKEIFNSDDFTACFTRGRAEETFKKEVLNPLIVAMNFVPEEQLDKAFQDIMAAVHKSTDSEVIKYARLADGTKICTKFDIVNTGRDNPSQQDRITIKHTITNKDGSTCIIDARVICDTNKGEVGSGRNFKVVSYSDSAKGTEFYFTDEQKGDPAISKKYEALLTQNVLAHHATDLGVKIPTGNEITSARC